MSPEEEQSGTQMAESTTLPEQISTQEPASVPSAEQQKEHSDSREGDEAVLPASSGFLDVLLQQAEAESTSPAQANSTRAISLSTEIPHGPEPDGVDQVDNVPEQTQQQEREIHGGAGPASLHPIEAKSEASVKATNDAAPDTISALEAAQADVPHAEPTLKPIPGEGNYDAGPVSIPVAQSGTPAASVQAEDNTNMTGTNDAPQEPREWETDSSPLDSSDSDTSTDSDDSDEDAGEYSMLDPEEQARILMQDDGGSDDEGKGKEKGTANVRTANERVEEVIPKPDIEVTADMKIEILGLVEATVESTVVVKAKTSGDYQVLESGSVLCLADRTVVGVVSETLGRVEQPLYTIRFTNDAAIEEAGLAQSGTSVYYVVPHSTFVFTQPLKGLKGSDASNFHDEEVGDDEMEFSDDEKEAEHKRQLKLKRQGRLGRDDGTRGGRGRGRGRGRGDHGSSNLRHSSMSSQSESIDASNGTLNYDDVLEDGYTPLRRPSTDHPSLPQPPSFPPMTAHRGDHRGRGRGNFRGRGRGFNSHNFNRPPFQPSHSTSHSNMSHQHQQMPPPSFPQQPFYPQQPPHLPPQPQFTPFSPSPISPLPGQQFNFAQFQNSPPPPPLPHQQQAQNAYTQGPGQAQGNVHANTNSNWPNAWPPPNLNATAMQQVQQHLEELNRLRGQGHGQ